MERSNVVAFCPNKQSERSNADLSMSFRLTASRCRTACTSDALKETYWIPFRIHAEGGPALPGGSTGTKPSPSTIEPPYGVGQTDDR